MNTNKLIENLKEQFGNEYDYSKVDYKGSHEKIEIICSKHGSFFKRIDHLNNNCLCDKCRNEQKIKDKWEKYVEHAKIIHKEKYEYIFDKSFKNINSKIKIICPIHGEFYQTFNCHINQKQGCSKCYNESKIGKYKMSTEEFIAKAKQVHGDKYDYSETIYNGLKNKVTIICKKHGKFEQVAYDHLKGFNCEKCKYDKNTDTKENFVKKARLVHGNKYDYSKVEYVNNKTRVCIICPKHGEFWQLPLDHLLGSGCQKCNMSHLENEIKLLLEKNNIKFIYQANSNEFKWLKRQSLDFYLPDYNIAIECHGKQHFEPIDLFGGKERLEEQIERDLRKKTICHNNNITLLYYTKQKMDKECFFNDKEKLLEYIKTKKENH